MKESLTSTKSKKTALKFKCPCGEVFISNEYKSGMMLRGSSGVDAQAKDTCPSCGKMVERGVVYRPLLGSAEHKKWYG